MNICVYCGASNRVDQKYVALADDLGAMIARRGHLLVYGGASNGLMGVVAQAVHREGGKVFGVIPQSLVDREMAYHNADELIITRDLRERKALMEARGDAFLALPGGIGTLEEVFEIMTLRHLSLTAKPLILINFEGFYDPLYALLDHMREEKFVREDHATLYYMAATVQAAFDYLDASPGGQTG